MTRPLASPHDDPPPLPPGTTWARHMDGEWSAGLPSLPWRVGSCRVVPVDTTGPRGGTRRAWYGRMAAGTEHATGPHATREHAARATLYAAGLIRHDGARPDDAITARYREVMAPDPPCPDCGASWPQGCDEDCLSRDE